MKIYDHNKITSLEFKVNEFTFVQGLRNHINIKVCFN